MTDLSVRLRIEAETDAAAASLRATEQRLRALGPAAEQAARGGAAVARGLRDTAEAAQAAGRAAQGQIGNLVAQLNDVGQMIVAGQSPLLLAVQQGTQIAQVLGPLGAGGAVRALGQAFLQLLNPVNLAVLGITAGVAVLGQWALSALSAGKETVDLAGALDALERSTTAHARAAREAAAPLEGLISRYGALAQAVREAQRAQAEAAAAEARRDIARALGVLDLPRPPAGAEIGALRQGRAALEEVRALGAALAEAEAAAAELRGQILRGGGAEQLAALDAAVDEVERLRAAFEAAAAAARQGADADLASFERTLERAASRMGITTDDAERLAEAIARLEAAGSAAEQAAAAAGALSVLEEVFGSIAAADAATDGAASGLSRLVRAAADLAVALGEAGAAGAAGMDKLTAGAETARGRVSELQRLTVELEGRRLGFAPEQIAGALARLEFDAANPVPPGASEADLAALAAAREKYLETARAVARLKAELRGLDADEAGAALLARLEREAAVRAAIARYGADSHQAAVARAAAERAAFEEQVSALGVSSDLADALLRAWEAARGVASVDLASGISAAAAEAARLGAFLSAIPGQIAAARQSADAAAARLSVLRGGGSPLEADLAAYEADLWAQAGNTSALDDRQASLLSTRIAELVAAERQKREAEAEAQRLIAERLRQSAPAGGGGGGGAAAPAAAGGIAALAAEAQAALSELDRALAQIDTRVELGLMSTAEAADAVAGAKRGAAEALADLVARLELLGPAGEAAAADLRSAVQSMVPEIRALSDGPLKSLQKGIEDIVVDLLTGVGDLGDAFSALGRLVLQELARIAAQQVIMPLLTPIIQGITGIFLSAEGSVIGASGIVPFATGGLPDLATFEGRIVDRPTAFALPGGRMGLMGEAGAEAILPVLGSTAAPAVRALLPGGAETAAPLARAASGHLAIRLPGSLLGQLDAIPFARGGVVGALAGALAGRPPRWAWPADGRAGSGSAASAPAPAPQVVVRPVRVEVVMNNARGDERVEETRFSDAEGEVVRVLIDRIDSALADNALRGRGALTAAMGGLFGLQRRPR